MTPAPPPPLPPTIAAALAAVGTALAGAPGRWWIIGSAAVALHGGRGVAIGDVDVLVTADAWTQVTGLRELRHDHRRPGLRFRSSRIAAWAAHGVGVELMTGLCVHGPSGWHPVLPETTDTRHVAEATVYIPLRIALVAMLHRFGRPKDRARAALLMP